MRRPLVLFFLTSAAALAAMGCESPTSVGDPPELGAVVALDSLRLVDAVAPPCCTVDSAGARVSIVAGTLTFRKYLHYTDTAFTPGGEMSAACVTEIPDGGAVYANGLVTFGDGAANLMIPCHVGGYTLAVTQRLDYPAGPPETADVTVSSGTYSWTWGALSLVDGAGAVVPAAMAWDTVVVTTAGRTYKLQAVRAR
ncbi:MAG TPA: hypothetical protein VMG58_13930 [Candidatus Sulfotelmatobacter sp.]|nr:hypothetical protein [Candidatus Sulfotelmatobacter sp.]